MKKLRFQPTFASLTEAELEQLACDVQREKYDAVRERICKPRSEGGLDLHFTSNNPLFRLRNKKDRLDLINARITSGQKLTLAQLDTITAAGSGPCGDHRAPEEVHDAIMSATYILVTEHDNTPHQLLALQRLADFPARADLREQSAQYLSRLRHQTLAHRTERMQITRAREARAQAKAQRAAEMHTHKIQMDHIRVFLRNPNRNLNPNLFSEDPQTSDAIDYNDAQVGPVSPSGPLSRDAIPSNIAIPSNQNAKIQSPENLVNPVEKSSSPSASSASTQHSDSNPGHPVIPVETPSSSPSFPSRPSVKSFLSPEVLANNRLYDQKLDSGEIRVIYAPGKHYEIEYCNPADQPALERLHKSAPLRFFEDPTRTQWLPALRTFGPNPYIPPQNTPS